MARAVVVFVVGHSNWGKSKTLSALTAGNYRVRTTQINGRSFFIRRMSNDDRPRRYVERMCAQVPSKHPAILAALCPDFDDKAKGTRRVLDALKRQGYTLAFWVQVTRYGSNERISEAELRELKAYGKVCKFEGSAEAPARARSLKAYVREVAGA